MVRKPPKAEGCPLTDRWGNPAPLEDLYLGGQVFLLCAGPSLKTLDLGKLRQRGIVTFGMNNVSAGFPTDFWTFGDRVAKMHDAIWRDQGIVKFVPHPKLREVKVREKAGPREFQPLGKCPRDFPGVFGVYRNSVFDIEKWLWEDTINWGNSKKHGNDLPPILNTMLQAVRLCYYLGFRTVYLLGADFRMTASERYGFDERVKPKAVESNMDRYATLNWYFRQLRPWFEHAGFEVLNCSANSELKAFDRIGFDDAVGRAALTCGTIDTYGWYEGFGDEMEDD